MINDKMLINMSKIDEAILEARKVHLDNTVSRSEIVYRHAVFGANTLNRIIVNFVIRALGLEEKVKHFNSENDALNWLKE